MLSQVVHIITTVLKRVGLIYDLRLHSFSKLFKSVKALITSKLFLESNEMDKNTLHFNAIKAFCENVANDEDVHI
jgi:hypothetical protein